MLLKNARPAVILPIIKSSPFPTNSIPGAPPVSFIPSKPLPISAPYLKLSDPSTICNLCVGVAVPIPTSPLADKNKPVEELANDFNSYVNTNQINTQI